MPGRPGVVNNVFSFLFKFFFSVIFHSEETYMFQNDGGSWFDYEISNVSPFEFLYYVLIPQVKM